VLLISSAEVSLADPLTLPGITNEYRFDDGNGTIAIDSVAGNNTVLHNFGVGNAQWIPGVFGGAVNYTNETAYVITDSAISASSGNQFSVSFWSRLNSKPNNNDSVLATPIPDNMITYNPTGNTNGLNKRGIGVNSVRDPSEPVLGVWENYVITYDRPSTVLTVYRNGVPKDSGDVTLPALNSRWVFGHNQGLDNTNGSFHGALDEIQIYNRVLTVSEIQMLQAQLYPQGDYNRSGTVDTADYLIWRKQVGNIVPACSGADANCNAFVENAEYQPWRNNFGRVGSSSASALGTEYGELMANVPEPTSLLLGVSGLVAITLFSPVHVRRGGR
jgi:hypothetical protein